MDFRHYPKRTKGAFMTFVLALNHILPLKVSRLNVLHRLADMFLGVETRQAVI